MKQSVPSNECEFLFKITLEITKSLLGISLQQ